MRDQLISAETIHSGWFDVVKLRVKPAEGEEVEREIVSHPSGAAVLPFDPERKVVMLVTEGRPAVVYAGEPRMPEAIGGVLEDGSPEECARREALEEGGLKLTRLDYIGRIWPTPATSTDRVDLYLAPYRPEDRVSEGGGLPEEEEHVRVWEAPIAELWERVEAGTSWDGKTLILLQALRIRRPDLF